MMGKRAHARMDELLSAYLDGELSPKEQARLEARLAADPALQARLEALRRTVALVRHLPRVQAPRNFLLTSTMVAPAQPRPATRRRWLAPALTFATATSALLCAMVLAGSLLTSGAPSLGLPPSEAPRRVAMEQTPEAEMASEQPTEEAEVLAEAAREEPEEVALPSPLAMPPSSPMPTPAAAYDGQASAGMTGTVEMTRALALTSEVSPTTAVPFPSMPTPEGIAATGAKEETPAPQAVPEEQGTQIAATSLRWPLVGGLALLTLGLSVASILAWLRRRW